MVTSEEHVQTVRTTLNHCPSENHSVFDLLLDFVSLSSDEIFSDQPMGTNHSILQRSEQLRNTAVDSTAEESPWITGRQYSLVILPKI
jgi:hypothetical protein